MARPELKKVASPNFTRAKDRKITAVVIHATATSGLQSPLEWLCLPNSKASAHYLIDKDGSIYQLVDERNIAWHAGISAWNGMEKPSAPGHPPSLNHCSIGIELVNPNDGYYPYPEEQIRACAALTASICRDYRIELYNVVGHCDIAIGRKTDPAGFDWDDFRDRLSREGIV